MKTIKIMVPCFVLWILCIQVVLADSKVRIVSTLSTFADVAKTIGGDRVEVSFVASPKFNPHFIEPRPNDVFKVKKADLFVHGGLDLEVWRDALVDAAGRSEIRRGGSRELDLSIGVALLEVPTGQVSRSEGDIHQYGNPHYWIDPRAASVMAQRLTVKLIEIDPDGAVLYQKNLAVFSGELEEKIVGWQHLARPVQGRRVVGHHNEWRYLMDFLGVKMEAFLEPKPGIPPTPRHLEDVLAQVQSENLRVVVRASFNPADAAEFVVKRSGGIVVELCQNVGERPEADSYLAMIDYNVKTLVKALTDG